MKKSLAERDQEIIWHPFSKLNTGVLPIEIVKAKGVYIYDSTGKKYIDAISSWWVNLHGHNHPKIVKAIANQTKKIDHVIFDGFTHESAIALAEGLLSVLPINLKKVFYSDDGSTAVEVALKMAFQYFYNTKKPKKYIIAFEGAYHGDTFGGMSVGDRTVFNKPFEKHLFEVLHIPIPNAKDKGKSLEKFKSVVTKHKNNIAAFIYEPLVQGAAGMRIYPKDELESILNYCTQKEILKIADEVMTGFGRTGKYFASDYLKNKPDVICLSKGITGGVLPLGATVCTKKIFDAFVSQKNDTHIRTFFHGHSYTANPISCAAAVASLNLLKSKSTRKNFERISKQHTAFAKEISKNNRVVNAKSLGTICSIEIKAEQSTGYLNPLREELYPYFISQGILLRPLGNVIYILPPYSISNAELKKVYRAIREFLLR